MNIDFLKSKTLKRKMFLDITKWLILIFLLVFSFLFFVKQDVFHIHLENMPYFLGFLFLFIFLILIVVYIAINLSINKHVCREFDSLKKDMETIKSGNLKKRLNFGPSEEINELTYFTNSLLDKLQRMLEMEKQHALLDPLTECYNRRALETNFEVLKDRAIREKKKISILLMDLDNFKNINDIYGHNVGDKVLINFSKIVRKDLRVYDILYRIGGEEFLVVFYDLEKKTQDMILSRMNKDVSYKLKKRVSGISHKISFSGGFVNSKNFDLRDKDVLEQMIKSADKFLYHVKETGKDRIKFKT